ncbi:hypothetical protein [Parerythrobacter lacustris]|uniref:Uncharacterized protein n=1 Tax=Parerythrobacter lacustris TaxID=2969984 RepID=A0ABT1XPJ5_9SPHN|nr:hypothetical protein [Parerythrobacter lacustris]MCR2833583.1 hypothetical protein [Parerythrobacter lacustris]
MAAPATAQDNDAAAQLEAAMSAHSNVADLLDAVKDCTAETVGAQNPGADALKAKGWAKLTDKQLNLERSDPASRSLAYVRRNVSLFVTRHPGGTTCRILAFLDTDTDRSGLTTGLQQDLGFSVMTRSSKFALRNPTVSEDMLAQFYETKAHLVRVKFEPESAALGVNIVVGPNL